MVRWLQERIMTPRGSTSSRRSNFQSFPTRIPFRTDNSIKEGAISISGFFSVWGSIIAYGRMQPFLGSIAFAFGSISLNHGMGGMHLVKTISVEINV
jgi:hypothetical protein